MIEMQFSASGGWGGREGEGEGIIRRRGEKERIEDN